MGYQKTFAELVDIAPDAKIGQTILAKISQEDHRNKRFRFAFFSVTTFAAFIALVPAFQEFALEISRSEFYQYFSLILSDNTLVITYWKELTYSLLESLPVMSTMLVFGALFILLSSLRLAVHNSARKRYQIHLA